MTKLTTIKQKKSPITSAHIIALGFLSIIVFGAIVLFLPISNRNNISFTDAFYLSTSAVCLTGLSTQPLALALTPFGQVFFLILIQAGGLGFTTIASLIFIAIRKKITYKERLLLQESLNQDSTRGVVRLTKNITVYMLVCEAIGFAILSPLFISKNGIIGLWQALFTSVSAFCNAGFDLFATENNLYPSLSEFSSSPLVLLTVAGLFIVGGLGFGVAANLTQKIKSNKKLNLNTKSILTYTALLLFLGTTFTLVFEYNGKAFKGMSFGEKLLNSFFQSATCRTAGFASVDQAQLSLPTKVLSMILMFIGGAPASTAGGIKVTTVAVVVAIMISGLKNRDDVFLFKHTLNSRSTIKAVSSMLIGIIIIVVISISVLLIEKHTALAKTDFYSLQDIMFETFSAFGTTGLSTGITPYLSAISKYLFIATMFFGRVGTITVGLLFFTSNTRQPFRYPEGNIMIG